VRQQQVPSALQKSHDGADRVTRTIRAMGGKRLSGEVAIVTGSTSGLGIEIARALAAEGAAVVVTGRDRARGEAAAATVSGSAFIACDLTDAADCERLVAGAVERFGSLTVLVNNAVSVAGNGPIGDIDDDAMRAALDANVVAPARLSRLAIPHMRAAGHGSIVHISSRAATRSGPGLAAYITSKGALEAMSRSITVDYAREGIRSNVVRPGYILHDVRDADPSPEKTQRITDMHLTRVPAGGDVAHAVVYLAGRESETVAGTVIVVDGGHSAARAKTLG
jgi:NAD(P)-dependent dehydrogenase (short-subunit alcohol dehydrogenase family)